MPTDVIGDARRSLAREPVVVRLRPGAAGRAADRDLNPLGGLEYLGPPLNDELDDAFEATSMTVLLTGPPFVHVVVRELERQIDIRIAGGAIDHRTLGLTGRSYRSLLGQVVAGQRRDAGAIQFRCLADFE